MAISIEQFSHNLNSSGLLSPEELARFQQRLPSGKRPRDAQGLAKELVRAGKLTRYQATSVYQGRSAGLVFGDYEILEKLGAGGMGVVYRARHRRMQREVAIKVLPPEALKRKEAVDRFYREVQAAARLNHTNIVTAYDASEHRGNHYLVMECVQGQDLATLLKERGPLPIDQALECVIQAARGLQYAHDQGIVHRDIKPANLLLSQDGTVKVLDMGLARFADEQGSSDELTQSGQIMGTVDYMAPEQAQETKAADARADIYSLGCTLHRLLTGAPLYEGQSVMNKILAHGQKPIPSLRAVRSDVSEQLDRVFQKMVAKTPEERQQSMAQVIAELEACRVKNASSPVLSGPLDEAVPLSQLVAGLNSAASRNFGTAAPQSRPDQRIKQAASLTRATPEATANFNSTEHETDPKTQHSLPPITPRIPRKSPWWTSRRVQVGSASGALALFAAVVFFFPTAHGTLRVEINDPEIEVSIKGTELVFKGADPKEVSLKPGEHVLHVKRGNFEFDTKSLRLTNGKSTIVSVELLDGSIRVASSGVEIGSQPLNGESPPASGAPAVTASDRSGKPGRGTEATDDNPRPESSPVNFEFELAHTLPSDHPVAHVVFSPDGKFLASSNFGIRDDDAQIVLWDARSGAKLRNIGEPLSDISFLGFLADGTLTAAKGHGPVYAWDPNTGMQTRTIEGIPGVAGLSRNTRLLATGHAITDLLRLHQVQWSGDVKPRMLWEHSRDEDQIVAGIAFSPNDRLVAAGMYRRKQNAPACIRIWDVLSGNLRQEWEAHSTIVGDVAFTVDGQWLLSVGNDKTLKIWNAQTWELENQIDTTPSYPQKIAVSPRGDLVALYCLFSDRILLIETSQWQVVQIFAVDLSQVHRVAIAFSPDGQMLAAACEDNAARIWKQVPAAASGP